MATLQSDTQKVVGRESWLEKQLQSPFYLWSLLCTKVRCRKRSAMSTEAIGADGLCGPALASHFPSDTASWNSPTEQPIHL